MKKNFWGLLSLMLIGIGLSGCEERTDDIVPPPSSEELLTVSLNLGFAEDSSDEFYRNGSPQRLAL